MERPVSRQVCRRGHDAAIGKTGAILPADADFKE
jgi:hypothetical protein